MEDGLRTLKEAVYEMDSDQPSGFSMLNNANFTNETDVSFVGLSAVRDNTGRASQWELKIAQGKKIGEAMDRIPFGILNKTITGLGATTLEITNQTRHSIIVVPTKALAYNKYIWAKNKYKCEYAFYVGSPIKMIKSSISQEMIRNYLNEDLSRKKKFLVVADSLPMLIGVLDKLGIDVYKDYFLMIDEIDTMQADSAYRPKLEIVIDYYFQFPRESRGVTSATLNAFSNPSFWEESSVTTSWTRQPRREIQLYYTNYVDDVAVEIIRNFASTTKDKILVAYNSIDGILNVIQQLDKVGYKKECGILCSTRSSDKVEEYSVKMDDDIIDDNGVLEKRIVFMTCAYFAGIDIQDKCHLISISSKKQPFTYLSANQLTQIAGRSRQGNLSEHIVYDVPNKCADNKYIDKDNYQTDLKKKAEGYADFLNVTRRAAELNSELAPLVKFIDSFVDFHAQTSLEANYPTRIVRQNHITKEFVPAYFNIDAMAEKWDLKYNLYSNAEKLYKVLSEHHIVKKNSEYNYMDKDWHDSADIKQIKERNAERNTENLNIAEQQLIEWLSTRDYRELEKYCAYNDKKVSIYFKAFRRLHCYIDPNRLLKDLKDCCNDFRKLRNYNNSLIFWALDDKNVFKLQVYAEFYYKISSMEKRRAFVPIEKRRILKGIFRKQLMLKNMNPDSIADFFKCFFKTQRCNAGKAEYIIGVNPNDFDGKPLKTISNNEDLLKLFIFPNGEI